MRVVTVAAFDHQRLVNAHPVTVMVTPSLIKIVLICDDMHHFFFLRQHKHFSRLKSSFGVRRAVSLYPSCG